MLPQYFLADRFGLDGAKQRSRGLGVIGLEAEFDDLAHRGVTQQIVGNFRGNFHRDLGGALVAFDLGRYFLVRTVGSTADLFRAAGGGTADLAYPVRSLDIADRPFDGLVPDFLAWSC